MTDKKVWFITGAGRGMGADIVEAAMAAGNAVVATGRRPEAVEQALGGAQEDLLVLKLDITSPADAQAAEPTTTRKSGRASRAGRLCGASRGASPTRCSKRWLQIRGVLL
jgi:NAD(P)-dependent dehydrogenase (short-subunit alcohol dehydrogenase family)